jgi:hypothetical protein
MNAGSHRDEKGQDRPPEGRYANSFHIGHNAFEFVFDFLQQYGNEAAPRSHTRVITSPAYAKAFLHTLATSIADYEREFSTIVPAHPDADDHD